MPMSTSSISCSSDVSEKALLERYLSPKVIAISSPINHSSQVRVVQHKQTRDLYALKYINKTKCVRMKAVANVIQERRLLEEVSLALPSLSHSPPTFHQIDHPFVVNLRYAFQDDENCFFVLDLMLGGDLRCPSFPIIYHPHWWAHLPHSSLGPIGFFARGDRQVLYGTAFFCCLFPA